MGLGGDFRQGGICRVGAWAPACVDIANAGDAFVGRVVVSAQGPDGSPIDAEASVTLAKGTVKRIVLPVRIYAYERELRVLLVEAGGRMAAEAKAPAALADPVRLVGVVTSLGRPGLPVADPDARRIQVVYLDPADLASDARVYDALDALVVLDPRAECADPVAAGAAMRAWVASGRPAVVTVGNAGPAMAGGPAAWAPGVPIARSADVGDFDSLRAAFAPGAGAVPSRRATCADLRGQPGRVLAADPAGLPLAVERGVGLGRLRLVAPDLQAAPFPGWEGLTRLWDRLLDLPTRTEAEREVRRVSAGQDPLQSAFESLRFLAPVSIGFVLLFLVAYILAVGPGDWWILRSLGRRYAWTWLTVPLWSLLFCGILYAVTASKRGGDLVVRAATVVDVVPGEPESSGVSYVAIYSPLSRRYDIRIGAPSGWVAPRGVGERGGGISFGGRGGAFADGPVPGFLAFPIASNVMRTLESEWRIPDGAYAASLSDAGAAGAVTLTNRGARPLGNAAVVWPDRSVSTAGALAPGASVEVSRPRLPLDVFLKNEGAADEPIGRILQEAYRWQDDGSVAGQDDGFLDRAGDILLWASLRALAHDTDKEDSDGAQSGWPPRAIPDRRARGRLDAAPALPRFRALVLGRDDAGPAPVRIDGRPVRATEAVLVRIWVP